MMTRSTALKAFRTISAILAILVALIALQNLTGAGSASRDPIAGLVLAALAIVVVGGLWFSRRSPVLGGALVLAAVVPPALAMYWTVLLPVLALMLIVLWYVAVWKDRAPRNSPDGGRLR